MLRLPRPAATAVVILLTAADAVYTQVSRPSIPPRDTTAAPPTGTARIRGRVTFADTGAPLRRAQVSIGSPEAAVQRMTTSDAEGRYEFAELPAGRYVITATKGGYVTLQAGQRRPFEPGNPVTLGDGQTLTNVDVALPRGSVIAGRITDEFGEAIAMAQVQAQRYQYGPGGQRRLTYSGGPFVMTDDLGQFRLYGLMPGEYVVSAVVRQMGMAMAMGPGSRNDSSEGYAPTFYPGTVNPADAQPVTVELGQELSLHIALAAARMARISGSVTDSQGKPAAGAMVMLRSGTGAMMMMMTTMAGRVAADGTFTLANVAPGDHFIDVRPPGRGPGSAAEFASVPVTVANENISGVHITTGTGATVKGRVVFAGTAPRTGGFGPLRVFAQAEDPQMPMMAMMGASMSDGTVSDIGAFELGGVSGKVLFRVNAPPTWALKSVTIDGEDMTDVPYELKGVQSLSDVHIVLTDKLTEVSGSVTDDRGRPLTDYVVVLLPSEPKEGAAAMRFTRTTRPDQQGAYRMRGLPPGEYLVAALESLEQGREWAPEFQDRVRDAARRITLTEGQSLTLDLKLTGGL